MRKVPTRRENETQEKAQNELASCSRNSEMTGFNACAHCRDQRLFWGWLFCPMQTTPRCWHAHSCVNRSQQHCTLQRDAPAKQVHRLGRTENEEERRAVHVKPSRAMTGSRMTSMVKYLRANLVKQTTFTAAKNTMVSSKAARSCTGGKS